MKRGKRSEMPRSSTYAHHQAPVSPRFSNDSCKEGKAYQTLRGRVDRTETEVRREHLPDDLGLEPDVGLRAADLDVPARRGHLEWLERRGVRLERLVAEPGADLADRLVLLRVGVVTREQERAVDVRALALAVVGAYDDEVERVADAREVVFLELWIQFSYKMCMGSRENRL